MDVLHKACIAISVVCLATMILVIPWGVFTRYVLGFGSSWPEPLAILMMVGSAIAPFWYFRRRGWLN